MILAFTLVGAITILAAYALALRANRTDDRRLDALERALARVLGDDWREIVSRPAASTHDLSTGYRENRGRDRATCPEKKTIEEDRSSWASFS